MKRCKFCQPSDVIGSHSVADYCNTDDTSQHITIDVYGGFLAVGFMLDGELKTLRQRIECCPVCGRKYEEDERHETLQG